MASDENRRIVLDNVQKYIDRLRYNNIPVWRLYLFGSYAKDTFNDDSDIDIAVFWDMEEIDGIDEDVKLTLLRTGIDSRIETHSFAKTDFCLDHHFVQEIIRNGLRLI